MDCLEDNQDYAVEQAYRRGCHQTVVMIRHTAEKMDGRQLVGFLEKMERELLKIRRDKKKAGKDGLYVFNLRRDLLHEAIAKILKGKK